MLSSTCVTSVSVSSHTVFLDVFILSFLLQVKLVFFTQLLIRTFLPNIRKNLRLKNLEDLHKAIKEELKGNLKGMPEFSSKGWFKNTKATGSKR